MIINADILDWAASYDGPLFHAVLCDAPYHLTSGNVSVDWSAFQSGKGSTNEGGRGHRDKGFMGKSWDGVDENGVGIAFNPETWRLIARCLHPGAFLFVFAGTINDDLISVAMRQAGLRKYHKGMAWGYGSGFPKATDLPAQIDEHTFQQWLAEHEEERAILDRFRAKVQECRQAHKANPTPTSRALVTAAHNAYRRKRQEIKKAAGFLKTNGTRRHQPKFDAAGFAYREKDNGYNSKERETFDVTAPATDLAQAWDGYSYGGQMLKPALESLLIFQKPYDGAPVDCITRTGAGALWIDGGRIGTEQRYNAPTQSAHAYGGFEMCDGDGSTVNGRWPSNLLLCHDPRCAPIGTRRVRGTKGEADYTKTGVQGPVSIVTNVKTGRHYADADGMETIAAWRCVESCPVRRLGEQSGEIGGGSFRGPGTRANGRGWKCVSTGESESPENYGDTGTAARFFFQASYMYERLEAADPLFYCAKADRAEREAGLDPRQIALLGMEEVEGEESGSIYGNETPEGAAARGRKPRHGFDQSTINDGRQKPIDNPYQRGETTRRNLHPTIKPLSLCRYLATLLLPPAMYAPRRLLVPFAGAASEYCGAILAGWDEIVGVEIGEDYCRIAEARAAYWTQRRHEFLDPSKPIEVRLDAAPEGQLDMFMGGI